MIKKVMFFSGMVLLSVSAFSQTSADQALQSITADELRGHIYYLASDEMGGRVATTPEYEMAAQYVATQFAAAGLKPAIQSETGENGYLQAVPFKKTIYDDQFELTVSTNTTKKTLTHNLDFKIIYGGELNFDALEVVWAGYGIHEPDYKWDDFENLDAAGKIIVCLEGAPMKKGKPVLPQEVHDKYSGSRGFRHKLIGGMMNLGAAGVILVNPEDTDGQSFNDISSRFTTEKTAYDDPAKSERRERRFPIVLTAKADLLNTILDGKKNNPLSEGYTFRKYQTEELEGITLSGRVEVLSEESIPSHNVIGLVEGTDPILKNEFIVVGAHLDHVRPRNGEVCNGADDNASGSSGVMEIAEAVAKTPFRRTVVFITYTAEEMGLIGSRYFVGSDLFPLQQLKFNVNLDMIGRTSPNNEDTRAHYVVTNKKYVDDLEKFIKGINQGVTDFPLLIQNDRESPGGSDHMSYIDEDIPAFFFFSGLHPDLHQPGDDPEKIDYQKAEQICRLSYLIVKKLANVEEVPDFVRNE